MTDTKALAKRTAADGSNTTFTEDEKAAMRERAKELKADSRRAKAGEVDGEADLLAKIADMDPDDRAIAEGVHAIVRASVPSLESKTWYGMPAYAKDGQIVAFFQPAAKFKARYSTLGFNDPAALDDGAMWATSYAITDLTPAVKARIAELVKKAAG